MRMVSHQIENTVRWKFLKIEILKLMYTIRGTQQQMSAE